MPQSTTARALSMKLKLSLLQRLGEDSEPNKDYNPQQDQALKLFMLNANDVMLKLTNSYPTSAVNLGSLRDPSLETSLTQMTMPMTPTLKECNLTESVESSNPKCRGSLEEMKRDVQGMKNARNLTDSLPYSLEISKPSSYGSKTPEQHHLDSQLWSGTTLSKDRLSTLTPCSHCCTIYPLLKRTLDAWDLLRSPLDDWNLQRGSKQVVNGPAPGMRPSKRLNSPFLIKNESSKSMESILKVISQPESNRCIEKSSYTTLPSGTKLGEGRMLCSLTLTISQDSTLPSKLVLKSHPNQPLVVSVCCGLCEGFWPWADTQSGEYPDTLDLSYP